MSGGELNRLRFRILNEVQLRYGREQVRIWQDVAAIPPGTEWERAIDDAIGESTFLIPILTPAFLESEYCCTEVRKFLAREAEINASHPELRGRRRIFPILYIDTTNATPHDPGIEPALKKLQLVDFRELRGEDERAAAPRAVIGRLAGEITSLLAVKVAAEATTKERVAESEGVWEDRGLEVGVARVDAERASTAMPWSTERGKLLALALSLVLALGAALLLLLGYGSRQMANARRQPVTVASAATSPVAGSSDTNMADTAMMPLYTSPLASERAKCAADGPLACFGRAGAYARGEDGVDQDYSVAAGLYQDACDGHIVPACDALAALYDVGRGVSKDAQKAREARAKGCAAGFEHDCTITAGDAKP
jgi:hypothetical protein